MTPPKTKEDWCLWRIRTSCELGCKVIEGKHETPDHHTRVEYALFLALKAMDDLAQYLQLKDQQTNPKPQ
jgi:hypothetical protein